MAEPENARDIDDKAVRWATRVDAGALGPEDQAELDAWLSDDPRRLGAFVRARAAIRLLDQAGATRRAGFAAVTSPSMLAVSSTGRVRHLAGISAIALSVTLLVGMGVKHVLAPRNGAGPRRNQRLPSRFRRGKPVGRGGQSMSSDA